MNLLDQIINRVIGGEPVDNIINEITNPINEGLKVHHRVKAPDGTEYRVVHNKDWGQWESRAYVDGKHHEPWTSYQSNKQDAIADANAQASQSSHKDGIPASEKIRIRQKLGDNW